VSIKDIYIKDRCNEIESLLTNITSWSNQNQGSELSAHLAAYTSVIITGMLEDCIEYLVSQRVGKLNDNEIKNYVCCNINKHFRNADYSAISGLLKEFSSDYQKKFSEKIIPNGTEATALESIIGNKNSLAHFGTSKLEMTTKDIDEYYHRIIPVLEVLEEILISK